MCNDTESQLFDWEVDRELDDEASCSIGSRWQLGIKERKDIRTIGNQISRSGGNRVNIPRLKRVMVIADIGGALQGAGGNARQWRVHQRYSSRSTTLQEGSYGSKRIINIRPHRRRRERVRIIFTNLMRTLDVNTSTIGLENSRSQMTHLADTFRVISLWDVEKWRLKLGKDAMVLWQRQQ